MDSNGFSFELYEQVPLIGIMRNLPEDILMKVSQLFVTAGFTNLEITMNSANATGLIAQLRSTFPQINIGAGTVTNLTELDAALEAGAQFIVTPITVKEVILACASREIPVFPGAYTPTEIHQAWEWGATAVKVFPANDLGPGFIKNVLAPLNNLKLIPTGGVNLENMEAFFAAGAKGVGVASSLFDKAMIAQEDFEGLAQHFKQFKSILDGVLKSG